MNIAISSAFVDNSFLDFLEDNGFEVNRDGLSIFGVFVVFDDKSCCFQHNWVSDGEDEFAYYVFDTFKGFCEKLKEIHGLEYKKQELSKYHRKITNRKTKESIMVDVYDVSEAFPTPCPALEHAKKKVLAAGKRGHKDYLEDLYDIQSSINSAIELELTRQDEPNN